MTSTESDIEEKKAIGSINVDNPVKEPDDNVAVPSVNEPPVIAPDAVIDVAAEIAPPVNVAVPSVNKSAVKSVPTVNAADVDRKRDV